MSKLGSFLKKKGFTVVDDPVRGRSSTWRGVSVITWHHYAGSEILANAANEANYVKHAIGRYPPLCQLYVDLSGRVWVISKERWFGQKSPGRASHMGYGNHRFLEPNRGNERALGIEFQCDGSHPLSTHSKMYETGLQLTRALMEFYKVPLDHVIGHKEYNPGKVDPRDDMNRVRRDIEGSTPPPPDDVPQKGQDWTVRPGNTLGWIAKHWGKSVGEIARYNNIEDPNKINVGQVIRWPKTAPPPPKFPTVGDNKVWPDYAAWGQRDSDSVRCIQHALIGKGQSIPAGATGFWGPQTIAATKSLIPGANGLPGPNTVGTILSGTPYRLQSGFGRDVRKWNGGKVYSGWVFYGNRNSDSVRNVQQRLIDLGHSIPAGPTGNYFSQTRNAARSFQRSVGLTVDGIVGPNTLKALFVAPKQHYLIVWGK